MRENVMQKRKTLETTDVVVCARVGDLVAYLYSEANGAEARDFHNHLNECDSCRAELSTFSDVREGIGAWRDAALNPMAAREVEAVAARNPSRRSALAAIREFFTLSPLWLRGATAFATLLLVALLVVTALNFINRNDAQVAEQTKTAPAKQDNGPTISLPLPTEEQTAKEDTSSEVNDTPSLRKRSANGARVASRSRTVRRDRSTVLSKEERSQLSDLWLIAEKDEDENVPRLYDLLSESN